MGVARRGADVTGCSSKSGTTALPAGPSVSATTCVISGTPTAATSSTAYTLTASNSEGSSADASVTMSVAAAMPTLSYAASTGKTVSVNQALSVTPSTLSGRGASITSCGINSGTTALPSTLSVNATTLIVGTLEGAGTISVNGGSGLDATDDSGGGGGGRISLQYIDDNNFLGAVNVNDLHPLR